RSSVIRGAGKYRAAVSQHHRSSVDPVRARGPGPKPFDGHAIPDLERPARPPIPYERAWAGQFKVPIRYRPLLVRYLDVEAGMRIRPFDFRHQPFQRDPFVAVILQSKRVMGGKRDTCAEEAETGNQEAEFRSHWDISRKQTLTPNCLFRGTVGSRENKRFK